MGRELPGAHPQKLDAREVGGVVEKLEGRVRALEEENARLRAG